MRIKLFFAAIAAAFSVSGVPAYAITCPSGSVATVASGCVDSLSDYVTSGQNARDQAALQNLDTTYSMFPPAFGGTQTDQSTDDMSYPGPTGSGLVFGGTGAKAPPFLDGFGVRPLDMSAQSVGNIAFNYALTLQGGGTGSCTYSAYPVSPLNAGTAYDLSGACTTPAGQSFSSTGTLAMGAAGSGLRKYLLNTGFGNLNGWWASIYGVVDLSSGSLYQASISAGASDASSSGGVGFAYIGNVTGGKITMQNPYAVQSTSTTVGINLSDGTHCAVYANAWPGSPNSQQTLVATCQNTSGKYTLYGNAGLNADGLFDTFLTGDGVNGASVQLSALYDPSSGSVTGQVITTSSGGQMQVATVSN